MSGASSKRVKSKGKVPSKRQRTTLASSEPQIFLTHKECEDTGLPLPPRNYGLDLKSARPSLSFSGDALERYNSLSSLKVLPFRYFDKLVMQKLGIWDDVRRILTTSGWSSWVDMDEPTCPNLVLEFFATLKCEFEVVNGNTSATRITFRMMGLWFSVRLVELCDWFGWRHKVGNHKPPRQFQTYFWPTISSDSQWSSSRIKSTKITSPSLSYIHRVMANSLYGNEGSNSAVSMAELGVLYFLHEGYRVDWGHLFVARMLELSRRKKGSLVFGGFITRIASRLGILNRGCSHIPWLEGRDPVATIDFSVLKKMGVISGTFENFRWTGYKSSQLACPTSPIRIEEEPASEPLPLAVERAGSSSHDHTEEFSDSQQARFERMERSIKDHIDMRFSEQRAWMEQLCASMTAQCHTSSRDPPLDPSPDA